MEVDGDAALGKVSTMQGTCSVASASGSASHGEDEVKGWYCVPGKPAFCQVEFSLSTVEWKKIHKRDTFTKKYSSADTLNEREGGIMQYSIARLSADPRCPPASPSAHRRPGFWVSCCRCAR